MHAYCIYEPPKVSKNFYPKLTQREFNVDGKCSYSYINSQN